MKFAKPNKILLGLGISALTIAATGAQAQSGLVKVETAAEDGQSGKSVREMVSLGEQGINRYMVTLKNTSALGGGDAVMGMGRGATLGGNNSSLFDFNGDMIEEEAIEFVRSQGARFIKTIPSHNIVVVEMDRTVKGSFLNSANVADVSDDPVRHLMAQSTPYGIPMVQANQLTQPNGSARKVCVIDTGYNDGHPDLPMGQGIANNSQVGQWDNDGNGHGTHVAGTVAALANDEGVVGVYPGVDVYTVKIFNDSGSWTFASDLIQGIQQCKNAGSNVVNMSLGGGGSSTAEANAMQGFVDDGMMLVAAAGNDGNSSMSYPASYSSIISVAAVDSSESRASYSQYNSQVEIAGPGSAVNSTWPVNTYRSISGTSMATPHVAGVAALVWSFFPQCTNEQIRSVLNNTAKDKGSAGRDNFYGYGIVQAKAAYDDINANGCNGGGTGGGNGGGNGGGVDPVSGQLSNLSGSRNAWDRYTWDIPAGVSSMTVQISGGSGDADLYLRLGSQPSTSAYDCRPYLNGNNEVCTITNPAAGTWHVGIRAYRTYSGVTMNYSYE